MCYWCVCVQDEAPVDSNTVSSTEDQTSGDTLEPEHESPILETKQVPSPLVWTTPPFFIRRQEVVLFFFLNED